MLFSNFRSLAASLVFPLFRSIAAWIRTISISLSNARRSTELFVLNQLAKSFGDGGLVATLLFSPEPSNYRITYLTHPIRRPVPQS